MSSITNDVIDVLVKTGLLESNGSGGVIPSLREITDASGNPVLAGADGVIIPTLGANTITVGAGGMYATIREALDYIVAQDTYTDLNVTGITSSITEDTKLVTMTPLDASTTSNTVGLGDKTFVLTGSGLAYVVGSTVSAADTNDSANFMQGTVKTWDNVTNTLVITVTTFEGSGTKTSWYVGVDVYNHLPRVHAGDLWSGDNGLNWYEISAILNPSKLTLEVPCSETFVGSVTKFARPIWYNILLMPGDHGEAGHLIWPVTKPMYVDIQAMPGARFTGEFETVVQQLWFFPPTGHVILRDLIGVATKRQSAFFNVVEEGYGTYWSHFTSILELNNCDVRSAGVDVWIPAVSGKIVIRGGYYEAGQDVLINHGRDGMYLYGATVVGTAHVGLGTFGQLSVRLFLTTTYAKDCIFEIRHPAPLFTGASCVFDAGTALPGATFVADNCVFNFNVVGAATTACLIGAFTSNYEISDNVKLNHCTMNSSHSSGTPNVMQVATYTGVGSVTVNNCVLNGFVAGGGGTVIPSLNNCSA